MFTYLKDQRADFYFLQETCSDGLNDESIWQSEFGGGGEVRFFFLMGNTIATVFAFYLIQPLTATWNASLVIIQGELF